ncbi:MAG: hypothetical protein KAJ90_05495, partial [Desulfobacterales bacterium]|nr:hypothetical protein [Desulfobacterales bacterium]
GIRSRGSGVGDQESGEVGDELSVLNSQVTDYDYLSTENYKFIYCRPREFLMNFFWTLSRRFASNRYEDIL